MKKSVVAAAVFAMLAAAAYAEHGAQKSRLSVSAAADFAYYPKSDYCPGGTHFAPLSGLYDRVEFRIVPAVGWTVPTPLGSHWLVRDAYVLLEGSVELTPVSVRPQISAGFQPLPFFVLKAGASLGVGWNIGEIEGLCKYDEESGTYETLSPFRHNYYDVWAQGIFMFDTGALVPGDWTHVVFVAKYQVAYKGITGLAGDAVYEWQCVKNQAAGLQYGAFFMLGYQIPRALKMVGVMAELSGHFDSGDYGRFGGNYGGDFMTADIQPFVQFALSGRDELTLLATISSRRSFRQAHGTPEEELLLDADGREWFFSRVALSYSRRF